MPLRATVIGTGYLGVTHAACLAESGCEVLGVDVDPGRVDTLTTGAAPFYEPGIAELLSRHVASGRLRFTTSFAQAGAFGDVHFLCVGTPQRRGSLSADLGQLETAVDELAPHLRDQSLVVGKSTVPVGTAQMLRDRLAAAAAGADVDLAWNPEFLREGSAVSDTLHPARIVIGVQSEMAEKMLREVYALQLDEGVPLMITDLATAELAKVAANAFLATKVSFMNVMADLCEETGADVVALQRAIGEDPRIGRRYLHAGLGFGGGCLPKDVHALMAQAEELGVGQAVSLLDQVDAINVRRRSRMVALTEAACGGYLGGSQVAVLGAAFKPGSDDVRDSPALGVAGELQLRGAIVRVYDPAARVNASQAFPALQLASSPRAAAAGADVVLHLTEWEEFRTMHPRVLSDVVRRKYIIDGRNALDPALWRREGWTYRGLGRP